MSYIWKNYNPEIFFDVFGETSVYTEVWDVHSQKRAVYPDYRFTSIFKPLEDNKFKEDGNLIIHCLVGIDNVRGALVNDIYRRIFDKEIRCGGFGDCRFYECLTVGDRNIFLDCLIEYYINGQKKSVFKRAVERLLENGSVFYDKPYNRYIIHSTETGNEYNMDKLELIKYFFLEAGSVTVDVWGYKYGIIGELDSPVIGQMTII